MRISVLMGVAVTAMIFSSCSPLYVPSTRNAALFRGAGEFQGSAHVGLVTSGVDLNAAVSATNHLGFMGGYNVVNRNTDSDNSDRYIKHKAWETAVGYYENTDKICYEFFGGYGQGEGNAYGNYFGGGDQRSNGTYSKIFVQPSVGTNNKIFNWMFTARLSYVDFDKVINLTDPAIAMKDPEAAIFIEPSFTGRIFFGQSPIYTQFQTGFSYTTQGDTVYDYQPFHFSFGFGLRLGAKPKISTTE